MFSKFTTRAIVIPASLFIKKADFQLSLANLTYDIMGYFLGPIVEFC